MFIKITCKDSEKVERVNNYVSERNIYLYFVIKKSFLISAEKILMSTERKDVFCNSYIFWIFLREGITVQSFIVAGYVGQICLHNKHPE